MRRTLRGIGKICFWGVIVVGLSVAGALLLIVKHLDEAVRAEVQRVFAEHYSQLLVSVRSAQRVEGQGIFVRGLSLKDPNLEGPHAETLCVDEIFIATQNSIDELVLGELTVDHVVLRRMALRAVRGGDGRWSLAQLLPLPCFGGDASPALIEDATLEIYDPTCETPKSLMLRRIQLKVQPHHIAANANSPARNVLNVEGELSSDAFQIAHLAGWVDPLEHSYQFSGDVRKMSVSPETVHVLPPPLSGYADKIRGLRGNTDFNFAVASTSTNFNANSNANSSFNSCTVPSFDLRGSIYDTQLDEGWLPIPLRDITAEFHLGNSGLQLSNVAAKGGGATLHGNLTRTGWRDSSPLLVDLHVRQMHVDNASAELLPTELRDKWRKLQPAGLFDVDAKVRFDGRRWYPELTIRSLGASFRYEAFPYQIENARGAISLKDDVLSFKLDATAASQPVTMSGRFDQVLNNPGGWLELSCPRPVPVDRRLHKALSTPALASAARVLKALRASGGISGSGRIDLRRTKSGPAQINEHIHLQVHNASLEYESFPYPMRQVYGEVEIWNGRFSFRNLQGRNDSAIVKCSGVYTGDLERPQLTLDFSCTDLPLEDDLRSALPPHARQAWNSLRPQGTVDRLDLKLLFDPQTNQTDLSAKAVKWPEQPNSSGQPISIYPRAFPYRMNQLQGEVIYRKGRIELIGMTATHGDATAKVDGFCQFSDDGSWRLQFSRLQSERISIDRDLIAAMPDRFAAGISSLNAAGPIGIDGAVEFQRDRNPANPVTSNWDLSLNLDNGSINCGAQLTNIHGSARFVGGKSAKGFYSRGELNIDSLMYQGFQFTNVTGPLWIDPSQAVFGAWAENAENGTVLRRVQAQVLGGRVAADLHITLGRDSQFTLQAQLDQGDLQRFAREFLPRERNISGKASGTVRISGNSRGRDTLRGNGRVWLRDADIYELPLMVALLKILKIRPLDNTAFTSSDIDFRVAGENIYCDRIVFNGNAISLKGAGEINLDRRVNLEFYTLVGSESRRIPLIWPLLADASRRILMIEVTGSLDRPVMNRNVLPGLNGTIERLFSEELGAAPNSSRGSEGGRPTRPTYQR